MGSAAAAACRTCFVGSLFADARKPRITSLGSMINEEEHALQARTMELEEAVTAHESPTLFFPATPCRA